jgi:hypothetical protein
MTRDEAKRTIRSRVVVKYGHTASLRHADDAIDALCDEYKTKIYELMQQDCADLFCNGKNKQYGTLRARPSEA